jgi:transcription initiation factor TFIIA large subunit
MSNNVVGNVYQQVIEEVINASRVDFEEGGVDESVLEELKKGWQQKLTQLEVAAFPWDPKPEAVPPPPPPHAAIPPAQDVLSHHQPTYAQQDHAPPQQAPAGIALPGAGGDSYVKQEPGIKQEAPLANFPPSAGGNLAAQRALNNIQQRYGDEAASSISQNYPVQAAQRPGQQPQGQGIALPQQQQQQHLQQQQQYRPPQQQQQQQQQQYSANPSQPPMKNSQVDGPGDDDGDFDDFQGVLMQRDAAGTLHELGRVDIDRMMHAQFMSNAKAMEGGGLMLPLKEATRHQTAVSKKGKERARGSAQYDGEDDDDEVADEDAINSDLDDSDEEKDDEEVDDESLGHIMLCMYDKVQRVKNKWKCVLKDGVLTVNGKEYVFHKATGEYEW